jgi:hypothetical protein
MKSKIIAFFYSAFLIILITGCRHDARNDDPITDTGYLTLKFLHYVDGQPLVTDSMMYVNAAGNHYEINQLKYFISDVTLFKSDGQDKFIDDIHYVDIDEPSTLTWQIPDTIFAGQYGSVVFVFGITEQKNQSHIFVNPPESNMEWPDILGGGYHYMMMNGKWIDTVSQVENFNFHLGIGQLYKSNDIDNVDSIYAFVQNYFTVFLPVSAFVVYKNQTTEIDIIMNIDRWFDSPNIYDHNYWGGSIMQNQAAMEMIKENGSDVFTTE